MHGLEAISWDDGAMITHIIEIFPIMMIYTVFVCFRTLRVWFVLDTL